MTAPPRDRLRIDPAHVKPRCQPWLRRAVALWVVLVVVLGVKSGLNPRKHSVFPLFVEGARHWWAVQSLYADYPGVIDVYEVFRYSPTCALAFSPLAALPDRAAAVLWNVLNLGVMAWGLRLAARDVFPGRHSSLRLACLLTLTFLGTVRPAWNGQSNPLVAGLILLAVSATARGRGWWAAAALAAAVYLKLSPIVLAALLVALHPRLLLGRLAATLLAGAALPFLTRPWPYVLDQYRDWVRLLAGSATTRWPGFRDLWTLWELTGHPVHVPTYRILQVAAGLMVLAWCLCLRRRTGDRRVVLTATLAMGSAYLMAFGPSVEHATYVVLAPTVAWAVVRSCERRRGQAGAILAYALTMVLGLELFERPLMARYPLVTAALPLGSLVFAGWLARHASRMGQVARLEIRLDQPKRSRHDAATRRDLSPPQPHTPLFATLDT